MQITDGLTHYTAKVDKLNRLRTKTETRTNKEISAQEGQRFTISSGLVTLTSANESGLVYFKNNSNYDFVITNLFMNVNLSTGGPTGCALMRFYTDSSALSGTLISGATTATAVNFNSGSTETLDGLAYRGVEGSTISGGTAATVAMLQLGREVVDFEAWIIPKGRAVALSIQPFTGNTSQQVHCGLTGYYLSPKISGE